MSALYIGMELRQLGINMNFAPTVDVYQNPNAHVIGPRAFSSNPALSGLLGTAYYQGLQQAGIIATAKHFPRARQRRRRQSWNAATGFY